MPIEIKEIVLKASVNKISSPSSEADNSSKVQTGGCEEVDNMLADFREEILMECLDMIKTGMKNIKKR